MWEPKSLKINDIVGAEAKNIFKYEGFWIGISNDGNFRYQSNEENATWVGDMPYARLPYARLPYASENQKTGNIGTNYCLYYDLYDSKWWTDVSCIVDSYHQLYAVCEIDN